MKRAISIADRVLVSVLGVALILGGAYALTWYFDVPWVVERVATFDRELFAQLPSRSWWQPTLAVTAAVAALIGIWLVIGNLSPRRTGTVQITRTDDSAVRVDLGAVARGLAGDLERFPGVRRARGSAIDDRGTPTVAVTVDVAAAFDLDAFTALSERAAHTVADSLDGAPVATRIQVHVDAAKR